MQKYLREFAIALVKDKNICCRQYFFQNYCKPRKPFNFKNNTKTFKKINSEIIQTLKIIDLLF